MIAFTLDLQEIKQNRLFSYEQKLKEMWKKSHKSDNCKILATSHE